MKDFLGNYINVGDDVIYLKLMLEYYDIGE